MTKKILISGTGQDASYLADLLLLDDCHVYCIARRSSYNNRKRLEHHFDDKNFAIVPGDVTDPICMDDIVCSIEPDEVYHLAAQSHVGESFGCPDYTFRSIVDSTKNLLHSIKEYASEAKFYHASSSEQFGDTTGWEFQTESTPFRPLSPYAVAKVCAHEITHYYRRVHGLRTYTGILFNHESPRRGEQFVTRKITKYIGRLLRGEVKDKLQLGDISAMRDWGFAGDYVRAMRRLLQQNKIFNVVIATGESYTVENFLNRAFNEVGLNWRDHVNTFSPAQMRPNEVKYLRGDAEIAKRALGWTPQVTFNELVTMMVSEDVGAAQAKT